MARKHFCASSKYFRLSRFNIQTFVLRVKMFEMKPFNRSLIVYALFFLTIKKRFTRLSMMVKKIVQLTL